MWIKKENIVANNNLSEKTIENNHEWHRKNRSRLVELQKERRKNNPERAAKIARNSALKQIMVSLLKIMIKCSNFKKVVAQFVVKNMGELCMLTTIIELIKFADYFVKNAIWQLALCKITLKC